MLSKRIQELEQILKAQNTTTLAQSSIPQNTDAAPAVRPSRDFPAEQISRYTTPTAVEVSNIPRDSEIGSSAFTEAMKKSSQQTLEVEEARTITNLLPASVRFDMATGRVRCFGSTASMNILTNVRAGRELERRETHWPVITVVQHFSPETHDYLLEMYWTCYNSVIHLVHKTAFQDDQRSGGTQFYSLLLHLAMAAAGFRYADKSRPDIQRLASSGHASSVLHEKAKNMAKLEMERPGGLTSIQALILLGDLECSIGRDDTGWLFAGA